MKKNRGSTVIALQLLGEDLLAALEKVRQQITNPNFRELLS